MQLVPFVYSTSSRLAHVNKNALYIRFIINKKLPTFYTALRMWANSQY